MKLRFRPIDIHSQVEILLVAKRMRETLKEVLGNDRGESMYSLDWLQDRVQFHLDPERSEGQVLVAETLINGELDNVGHTILRFETDESNTRFGLFSTFYVVPEFRKQKVASNFLTLGEQWMMEKHAVYGATDTAKGNEKLIRLLSKSGYHKSFENLEMIRLKKVF
ncbi:MAG: GNAT family N-acetyltransferase [Proteobacteria bacterium]|nr:GNAT family N-acetyltransferase [Pseudomonadota bacterium]